MERPTKTVRQLLAAKHSEVSGVISVTPSDTVLFALKLMREKNIGAVVVLDGLELRGILTERDYAQDGSSSTARPRRARSCTRS